jgi:hypothetical protein
MSKKLKISTKLALPIDAVTSTLVVYGGKGMGKTNFASVLVEEFSAADLRFVVIDPMGVWWGLRHSVDGKGVGIEVLILGGIHGDLPIEPSSGDVVADLVVDENVSVIIDISRRSDGSMWSIGERVRFVTDFAKRVYQRQGEKRRPLHLVIDEAARFAPQIVRQGELEVAKCMGAVAVIVEEGRNVGIGVTMVTQRSARLNKDVAELADCMISFRVVGPNSTRAVLDWLGAHVDKARLKEIGEQLRELPRGSALVVSPGWLEFEGIVPMRARTTFDSSATPKTGQQVRASGPGAKPDLAKYRERLAEVVERAIADDPKELKKKLAALNKEFERMKLQAANEVVMVKTKPPKTIEKSILKDAHVKRLESAVAGFEKKAERLDGELQDIRALAADLRRAITAGLSQPSTPIVFVDTRDRRVPSIAIGAQQHPPMGSGRLRLNSTSTRDVSRTPASVNSSRDMSADHDGSNGKLPPGEAKIIDAAIQFGGITKDRLRVLVGYKRSARDAYVSRAMKRGYLVVDNAGLIIATAAGIAARPNAERLPTGDELQAHWFARLPPGERVILEQLIAAYPAPMPKEEITAGDYKHSARDAYLSRLAARGLVENGRGQARASEDLFS